jgi:hypothetical protein
MSEGEIGYLTMVLLAVIAFMVTVAWVQKH